MLQGMRDPARLMRRTLCNLLRCAFPGHCALCGVSVADGYFCAKCLEHLPLIRDACERCGVPVPAALPPGVVCARCRLAPLPFARARALLHYTFPVDAALKALKFRRRLHYLPAFTSLLWPALDGFPGIDALAPVPLHRYRHAIRGFNQAHELAKPIARTLGLPFVAGTRRVRRTRPQTGLCASERRRNLENAFAVAGRLDCRHPLIVDDVMTTGETCAELAAALLRAGAEEVSVLTVARAALVRPRPDETYSRARYR